MIIKSMNWLVKKLSIYLMESDYKSGNLTSSNNNDFRLPITQRASGGGYAGGSMDLERMLGLAKLDTKSLFEKIDPNLDKKNQEAINAIMFIRRTYEQKAYNMISSVLAVFISIIALIITIIK